MTVRNVQAPGTTTYAANAQTATEHPAVIAAREYLGAPMRNGMTMPQATELKQRIINEGLRDPAELASSTTALLHFSRSLREYGWHGAASSIEWCVDNAVREFPTARAALAAQRGANAAHVTQMPQARPRSLVDGIVDLFKVGVQMQMLPITLAMQQAQHLAGQYQPSVVRAQTPFEPTQPVAAPRAQPPPLPEAARRR